MSSIMSDTNSLQAICRNFVDAVRVARQMQKDRSDFTTLSKIFTVPAEEPWPKHLQGQTLFSANIRCFYKTKKIDATIIDELDALCFVWDPQDHQRNMELLAFKTYLSLHDDLCVPSMFVVPNLDPKWPKDTWNMHLGLVAKTIRSSWKSLPDAQRKTLIDLGFIWQDVELTADSRIAACEWFKQINGHFIVPENFVVPKDDPAWPETLHNIPLGMIVAEMKRASHKIQPSEYVALKKLGMTFDNVDSVVWEEKIQALVIYNQIHGDLLVPSRYKVPVNETRWPKSMCGMGLGGIVSRLRRESNNVCQERYNQLKNMGFVWDMDEYMWTRKIKALQTYKELYGNLRIPQVFNVPMHDSKWPKETWGFKLGRAIDKLREYRATLTPERFEMLTEMGFVWRCRRKRRQKSKKTVMSPQEM
ncbi:hypothetical protein AeRB84_001520 [Aphanomyces euteiches]|nr:hypothetical protein AeRB84_001520 [Aphanomyces euteiches]